MALDRRTFLARAGLTAAASGLVSSCSTPACALTTAEGALDWAAVRGLFNLAPDWIHLASFFLVSHPKPVREAIDEYPRAPLQRPANPAGPGDPDDGARPLLAPRVDPARERQERRERAAHRAARRGRRRWA